MHSYSDKKKSTKKVSITTTFEATTKSQSPNEFNDDVFVHKGYSYGKFWTNFWRTVFQVHLLEIKDLDDFTRYYQQTGLKPVSLPYLIVRWLLLLHQISATIVITIMEPSFGRWICLITAASFQLQTTTLALHVLLLTYRYLSSEERKPTLLIYIAKAYWVCNVVSISWSILIGLMHIHVAIYLPYYKFEKAFYHKTIIAYGPMAIASLDILTVRYPFKAGMIYYHVPFVLAFLVYVSLYKMIDPGYDIDREWATDVDVLMYDWQDVTETLGAYILFVCFSVVLHILVLFFIELRPFMTQKKARRRRK